MTLPLRRPFRGGGWLFAGVSCAVVRVVAEDGRTGLGYLFAFSPERANVLEAGIRSLAPLLRGMDALACREVYETLQRSVHAIELGSLIHPLVGAIDMALWDIAGKVYGTPLYRLFGGVASRVLAYGSGGSLDLTTQELCREAAEYAAHGFTAVKIKLRADASDLERVRSLRTALGEGIRIIVDANQQLDARGAEELARGLAEYGVHWLEEPIPHGEWEAASALRSRMPVPLAMGESEFGERAFFEISALGAADILQPNLGRVGGFTGFLRVRDYAAARGLRLTSHTYPYLSAHALATVPGAEPLEYMDWWDGLFQEPLRTEGGYVELPDRPGHGLEARRDIAFSTVS